QIVARAIHKGFISTKSGKSGARGGNGWSQSELHAIKLASHKDAGQEVGIHADGLQAVGKSCVIQRGIKASNAANLGIRERRHTLAEIIGAHPYVTVVDDESVVLRF